MPFSRPISSAAARYGQQATNIAQTATANIGNIIMGIAQARAQGVQEGSRAWANMLQQLGVTAQQWPMIRRQMEEYEAQKEARQYEISTWRPMREAIAKAGLEQTEAAAAELRSRANERNMEAQGRAAYIKWSAAGADPNNIPPEAVPSIQKALQEAMDYRTKQLANDAAERKVTADLTAEKARLSGVYLLETKDLDPNDPYTPFKKQASYKNFRDSLNALGKKGGIGDSPLPEAVDQDAEDYISHLYNVSSATSEIDKSLKSEPTAEEAMKGLDFAIRTTANLKTPVERTRRLDYLVKEKWIDEGTRAIFPAVDSPNWAEEVKALGAEKKSNFQQKTGTIAGKPAVVNYDPSSGKSYDASGRDVTEQFMPKAEDETATELRQVRLELMKTQLADAKKSGDMTSADWRGILANVRMLAGSPFSEYSNDLEAAAKALGTTMAEINAGIQEKPFSSPAPTKGGNLPPGWTP